tara:strand:+ start:1040 stop:1684 length:645 start_codon:yes stop_codon:yes gene_type:complete
MKYGDLPKVLGIAKVNVDEMLFYQYLPIKLRHTNIVLEERLYGLTSLLYDVIDDFKEEFGVDEYNNNYCYLTIKKMYQKDGCSFNRNGYHSDGFLTNDINYIWCDKNPTIFNTTNFDLTLDDNISISEMAHQAHKNKEKFYPENTLLRLNQYNIHKVSEVKELTLRTFIKVSFSKDKYDLKGNSINYKLGYNWEMRERNEERNIPQNIEVNNNQ